MLNREFINEHVLGLIKDLEEVKRKIDEAISEGIEHHYIRFLKIALFLKEKNVKADIKELLQILCEDPEDGEPEDILEIVQEGKRVLVDYESPSSIFSVLSEFENGLTFWNSKNSRIQASKVGYACHTGAYCSFGYDCTSDEYTELGSLHFTNIALFGIVKVCNAPLNCSVFINESSELCVLYDNMKVNKIYHTAINNGKREVVKLEALLIYSCYEEDRSRIVIGVGKIGKFQANNSLIKQYLDSSKYTNTMRPAFIHVSIENLALIEITEDSPVQFGDQDKIYPLTATTSYRVTLPAKTSHPSAQNSPFFTLTVFDVKSPSSAFSQDFNVRSSSSLYQWRWLRSSLLPQWSNPRVTRRKQVFSVDMWPFYGLEMVAEKLFCHSCSPNLHTPSPHQRIEQFNRKNTLSSKIVSLGGGAVWKGS